MAPLAGRAGGARSAAFRDPVVDYCTETTRLVECPEGGGGMSTHLGRFHQRFSDPLLTVLTLMLLFLLFGIGPMQASGIMTGQHFGYFFGLVLLPAAFLYSRNLLI